VKFEFQKVLKEKLELWAENNFRKGKGNFEILRKIRAGNFLHRGGI
jgi:hypothetical protein